MLALQRHDFERWAKVTPPACYSIKRLRKDFKQVSRRQLYRLIHHFFDLTPQKWLDERRMALAAEALLKYGSIKIASAFLGYKQPTHFTRVFKRAFGVCPKAVLRRHRAPETRTVQPRT